MGQISFTGSYNGPASSWQYATYRLPSGGTVRLPVEVSGEQITLQIAPVKFS